jgi:hypothetical protein
MDTLDVWFPSLPKGARKKLQAAHGRRVRIDPCQFGVMVSVQTPQPKVLEVLGDLQRTPGQNIEARYRI